MRNGIIFVLVFFIWIIGSIGGFGYLCYINEYFCAIGALMNGLFAFPFVKKLFNKAREE